jgi:hypothetical protein
MRRPYVEKSGMGHFIRDFSKELIANGQISSQR